MDPTNVYEISGLVAFFALLILFSYFLDPLIAQQISLTNDMGSRVSALSSNPTMLTFMSSVVALLLFPYSIFVAMRFAFRTKLRRVVSGMRFADSLIPSSLGYSFFKEDLTSSLFRGEVLAQHEVSGSSTSDRPPMWNSAASEHASRSPSGPEALARVIHAGNCPECGLAGPTDVHMSYRVWSLLYTRYSELEMISCRRCAARAQLVGIVYSLALGWWGIWGLLYTPLQVIRNLLGLLNPPPSAYPSARLIEVLTSEMAASRHQEPLSLLTFQCWRCKSSIEVIHKMRGKTMRCPFCQTKQAVPV